MFTEGFGPNSVCFNWSLSAHTHTHTHTHSLTSSLVTWKHSSDHLNHTFLAWIHNKSQRALNNLLLHHSTRYYSTQTGWRQTSSTHTHTHTHTLIHKIKM